MKSSAVAHGLKSIAERLHPQLPLTSRESQRLLNALTTSFRRHLDEAHPSNPGDDDVANTLPGGKAHDSARNMHSSAAHMDKHLASVLTSPLFAMQANDRSPQRDLESVKARLAKDPSRDPILLLEEYDKQGRAPVAIAEACLDSLKRLLDTLPPEERNSKLNDLEPGRRAMLWLLRNQLYASPSLVENTRVIDLLCYLLIREGHEDALWDWLRLDLVVEESSESQAFSTESKRKTYQYRWRGKLASSICRVKLGALDSTDQHLNAGNLHSALDAFSTAWEIRQNAPVRHHLRWFPLKPAAWALRSALLSKFPDRVNIDVNRYDTFVSQFRMAFVDSVTSRSYVAGLLLDHPTSPSVDLAYAVATEILSADPSKEGLRLLQTIRDDPLSLKSRYWYSFLVSTVRRLSAEERKEEARWLKTRALEMFSHLATDLEKELKPPQRQGTINLKKEATSARKPRSLEVRDSGLFQPSFG